jgi:hypothetical protein
MSAGVTDYGANAFADHFSGQATLPTTLYVALCFSEPDVGSDGTTLAAIEPTGGSYARMSIARSSAAWGVADQGISPSTVTLTFPTATADWGIITHYALCTASSAGQVLGFGLFSYQQRVMSGDILVIDPGGISMAFVGPSNPLVL